MANGYVDKAKKRAYNHAYYESHKEKWDRYRREQSANDWYTRQYTANKQKAQAEQQRARNDAATAYYTRQYTANKEARAKEKAKQKAIDAAATAYYNREYGLKKNRRVQSQGDAERSATAYYNREYAKNKAKRKAAEKTKNFLGRYRNSDSTAVKNMMWRSEGKAALKKARPGDDVSALLRQATGRKYGNHKGFTGELWRWRNERKLRKSKTKRAGTDTYGPGSPGYEFEKRLRKAESDEIRNYQRSRTGADTLGDSALHTKSGRSKVGDQMRYRTERLKDVHTRTENGGGRFKRESDTLKARKKWAKENGVRIPSFDQARKAGFRDVESYLRYMQQHAGTHR